MLWFFNRNNKVDASTQTEKAQINCHNRASQTSPMSYKEEEAAKIYHDVTQFSTVETQVSGTDIDETAYIAKVKDLGFEHFSTLVECYFYNDQAIIRFNKAKVESNKLDEELDFFIPLLGIKKATKQKDANSNICYCYFPSISKRMGYELSYVRQDKNEVKFLNDPNHPEPLFTLQCSNNQDSLTLKKTQACYTKDVAKAHHLFTDMKSGKFKAEQSAHISKTNLRLYYSERKNLYVCTYSEGINQKIGFKQGLKPWEEYILTPGEWYRDGGSYDKYIKSDSYSLLHYDVRTDRHILDKTIELDEVDLSRLASLAFDIKIQRITPLSVDKQPLETDSAHKQESSSPLK